ncbi:MAG: hypothetical protein FWC87_00215 [Acidimicrobiaceae bacterium]|nr:hypothetical protein [Acidimicrobiaceae bacterium]
MDDRISRELLPVANLKIDPLVNTRKNHALWDAWRPDLAHDIDSYPDLDSRPTKAQNGIFCAADGGTRLINARHFHITALWARVHWDVDSQAKAAQLCLDLNQNRKQFVALAEFQARITAGDPVAVEAHRILTQFGYRLDRAGRKHRTKAIAATAPLVRGVELGTLETAFSLIHDVWEDDQDCCHTWFLDGLVAFLGAYPEAAQNGVAQKFRFLKPSRVMAAAKELSLLQHQRIDQAMAEQFLAAYNKGRREPQRLPIRPLPKGRSFHGPSR